MGLNPKRELPQSDIYLGYLVSLFVMVSFAFLLNKFECGVSF